MLAMKAQQTESFPQATVTLQERSCSAASIPGLCWEQHTAVEGEVHARMLQGQVVVSGVGHTFLCAWQAPTATPYPDLCAQVLQVEPAP